MKVFGVSQTSGEERRLDVERGATGIVLVISDHPAGTERARVLLPTDGLLAAVTDPVPGGSTVEGTSPAYGTRLPLSLEVRRNEVWLTACGEAGAADVAVGLDDFQDALEGAIPKA
jgi:hypothetical protein